MKVLAVGLVYWNPFSRRDPSLVTFVAIAQGIDGNHFHCAAVVLVWFESSEAKVWDWEHAPGIQNMFSEVALAFPINHYGREMEKWRNGGATIIFYREQNLFRFTSSSSSPLRANGRNNSQHCWPSNVDSCCT